MISSYTSCNNWRSGKKRGKEGRKKGKGGGYQQRPKLQQFLRPSYGLCCISFPFPLLVVTAVIVVTVRIFVIVVRAEFVVTVLEIVVVVEERTVAVVRVVGLH